MFSSYKIYFIAAIVIYVVGSTWMLLSAREEIGEVNAQNATLTTNIDTLKSSLEHERAFSNEVAEINVQLSKDISSNANTLNEQQAVFNSHDLETLLEKKPATIIRLSNNKTQALFNDFENSTLKFQNGDEHE